MLKITETVHDQLRSHGEAAYPREFCGVLLGLCADGETQVHRLVPADNASANPRNRYEIAAKDLIFALRLARESGCEIVGFAHSHPDCSAQPSATDLAEAHWLGCSYVITEIREGRAQLTNAFHLAGSREEDKHLELEELAVILAPGQDRAG